MERAGSGILVIIGGNLLLLAAGLWLGWTVIHCLIVYWLESCLLLPLTLARIGLIAARGGEWKRGLGLDNGWSRLYEVFGFCVGYAIVTYIAGIFVFGILPAFTGMDRLFEGAIGGIVAVVTTVISREPAILAAVLVLAVEHAVLLLRGDLATDEGGSAETAEEVMKRSMAHQVYLLAAVIIAAFAIAPLFLLLVNGVFGKVASPGPYSIAVLVLLKTAVECVVRRRQSGRQAQAS